MKESHGEGLASHTGPESCADGRKSAGEALTGEHAGQPLSSEITLIGMPTPSPEGEGHTPGGASELIVNVCSSLMISPGFHVVVGRLHAAGMASLAPKTLVVFGCKTWTNTR